MIGDNKGTARGFSDGEIKLYGFDIGIGLQRAAIALTHITTDAVENLISAWVVKFGTVPLVCRDALNQEWWLREQDPPKQVSEDMAVFARSRMVALSEPGPLAMPERCVVGIRIDGAKATVTTWIR